MRIQGRSFAAGAARFYRLFGLSAMIAALAMISLILFMATVNGLTDGNYSILVVTNRFDENFIELTLLMLAIPAAASEVRRLFDSTAS